MFVFGSHINWDLRIAQIDMCKLHMIWIQSLSFWNHASTDMKAGLDESMYAE